MERQPLPIAQIDNRESTRTVTYFKRKLKEAGFDVQVSSLPVGDIVIPDKGICIERKTIEDFMGSFRDGRIDAQIQQMQDYPVRCIIVQGVTKHQSFKYRRHMTEMQYWGAIRSVVLKKDCPLIQVESNYQFWQVLRSIIKHAGEIDEPIQGRQVVVSTKDAKEGVLCAVPGLGPKASREILKKYPTMPAILNALLTDTFSVKGVGKKRISSMEDVFLK